MGFCCPGTGSSGDLLPRPECAPLWHPPMLHALAASTDPARSRQINLVIGIGLLAAFVLGVAGGANFLDIDGVAESDNWLHLTWGAASITFARRALEN